MDHKIISGNDSGEKRLKLGQMLPPHSFELCLLHYSSIQVFSFSAHFCLNLIVGVPRLNTPPPLSTKSTSSNQERAIVAPKPIRVTPNLVTRLEDLQPWTRSPTKSKMEPVVETWKFTSSDPSQANKLALGKSFCGLHKVLL